MRAILLSLLFFATFFFFSSATPLDKAIDGFNRMLGLDMPKLGKNFFSKKVKPPGKQPGPKVFPEAQGFDFLPDIATKMIPKISSLRQDDDRHHKKKHLYKMYENTGPLRKQPTDSFQGDATNYDQVIPSLNGNKNSQDTKKHLEKTSALPVNFH